MNNRPFTYIEEDIHRPISTPNSMILGRETKMLERNMIEEEEEDLSWRKRQMYVKKSKNVAWRRWQREYKTALRERHSMQHKSRDVNINLGDVVMIKDESKKRGKIGIISELFQGKDDQIRGARVKTPRGYMDRPI